MDTKNVLMAVILSTLVLVFWGTFFEPPVSEIQVEKKLFQIGLFSLGLVITKQSSIK